MPRDPESRNSCSQVMTVITLIRAHLLLYHMAQNDADEFEHLMSAHGTALEVAYIMLKQSSLDDANCTDQAGESSVPGKESS